MSSHVDQYYNSESINRASDDFMPRFSLKIKSLQEHERDKTASALKTYKILIL